MGELLDVVHKAEELPLPIELLAAAHGEAIERFVVPHIREHGFDRRETPPVARAMTYMRLGRTAATLMRTFHDMGNATP